MTANWQNRTLFHGDNLAFMRAMNSDSVDLIATDPPFNKSRDFHATPDSLAAGAKFQDRWSWERDVHQEWIDQITDDYPRLMEAIESARYAHSDGMGAFMCFMAVRLLAMHRLLKPTGSIYLHCDPTASHYLKAVMDAIFGYRNFRNQITWRRTPFSSSSKARAKQLPRDHDVIFLYSKSTKSVWNAPTQPYSEEYLKRFKWQDKRGFYRKTLLKTYSQETFDRLRREDRLIEPVKPGAKYSYKQYLNESGGTRQIGDVWTDINMLNPVAKERAGYPTQKPLALYERIIKASSNEGDMVLDPFAGCATTCVAAERLGRQWAGIDIWEKAHEVVRGRLENEVGLFGKVTYTDKPPERTDGGDTASPFLRVKQRVKEPEGPRWTRAEMYAHLLEQNGPICQGCDREFDDPRYLELDHNTPRSSGGINHITNRILLCGPCNPPQEQYIHADRTQAGKPEARPHESRWAMRLRQ